MRRVPAIAARLGAGVCALALPGCTGVLDPAGPVGAREKQLLLTALAEMLGIIVPVIVLTLAFAWWFRKSNTKAKRRPEFTHDYRIEFVVWVIPFLSVLFLGALGWVGSHELDPYKPVRGSERPIEVDVVALDWKWLFLYPGEGIASVNQLVVPVGAPVHFRITSGTVMNTFFVPQLGGMIYAMPGMASQLWYRADRPGSYFGLSGMFSGDGFPRMNFRAVALPASGFAGWVARARATGRTLDAAAFRTLATPGLTGIGTFGATEPGLFTRIVGWSALPPRPRNLSHGGSVEEASGPPTPDPFVAEPPVQPHLGRPSLAATMVEERGQ